MVDEKMKSSIEPYHQTHEFTFRKFSPTSKPAPPKDIQRKEERVLEMKIFIMKQFLSPCLQNEL